MTKWLRSEQSHIVAITGSKDFIGEQERIEGFEPLVGRSLITVTTGIRCLSRVSIVGFSNSEWAALRMISPPS
jgi:hypothetical protein